MSDTTLYTYTPPPPSDILFVSPTLIPGDDADPYEADVLISNGLIATIGLPNSLTPTPTTRRIDAKGYYLSPGFIDMHAHSDLYLITNPEHEAKISQGCTVSLRNGYMGGPL